MFKFGLLQSTYGHLGKGSYTTISRHSEPIVGRKCTCASERTTSLDGARPRGPINTRRQTKHRKSTGVFKPSIEPIVYGRGPIVRVRDGRTRRIPSRGDVKQRRAPQHKGMFFWPHRATRRPLSKQGKYKKFYCIFMSSSLYQCKVG